MNNDPAPKVKPKVVIQKDVRQDIRQATHYATVNTPADFHHGQHVITVEEANLSKPGSGSAFANTQTVSSGPNTDFSRMKVDPKAFDAKTKTGFRGQVAQVITHEIAAHSLPNLEKAAHGQREDPHQTQHAHMYQPGPARNKYMQYSHNTFNALQSPIEKRAYVASWHDDMTRQIATGPVLTNPQNAAAINWANNRRDSMEDAINTPSSHSWATKDSPVEKVMKQHTEHQNVTNPKTKRQSKAVGRGMKSPSF